jgi:uncharacterized protein
MLVVMGMGSPENRPKGADDSYRERGRGVFRNPPLRRVFCYEAPRRHWAGDDDRRDRGLRRYFVSPLTEAVLLRVFLQEEDRYGRHALYKAIVARALEEKMAGATVLPGPLGFGRLRRVRSELNVDAGLGLPMVIELVDSAEQIDRFLPILNEMVDSGVVTLEKVRAIRYRRQDASRETSASPPAQ